MIMFWTVIVVLVALWLFGVLGMKITPKIPKPGYWVHTLIALVGILLILHTVGVV
jgi:hypothetical protein